MSRSILVEILFGVKSCRLNVEVWHSLNIRVCICESARFVCTRLLSVSDFSDVQKVPEVLESVGNEFPRLLTSLGRVIVKLARTELSLESLHELAEE